MQTHYFTRDVPMHDIESASQVMPGMNNGKVIPKFFTRAVQDHAATEARGRYVAREIEMIRLIIPGDKHSMPERRVRESDKTRFAREYEAFKKQQDFVPDGTPLETWPLLSRAQVENLRQMNVYTVESLAGLSDEQLSNVGIGARTLRAHAKAFLETSETGKVPARLVAENERLAQQVEMLTTRLEDLTNRLEQMSAKAGKDVAEMDSPYLDVRKEIANVKSSKQPIVSIPEDYQSLSLKALKEICGQIDKDVPILTKQNAFELIEEYNSASL